MSSDGRASSRRHLLPLFLVLAALSGACQSQRTGQASPSAVSPDVWAVVDGREIRREEIEKAYRRTVQPNPAVSEEEALTAKLTLLDQAIIEDVILARARELKIELPERELDGAFNDQKKGIDEDAFNKELATRNLTAADIRESLRRDLTTQKLFDQEVTSKITVTDQDINDFFQANKAQFNLTEETYHLAQIIVTPVKEPQITNRTGDDATSSQAAAAKAQMLMQRLKSGTPFNELAMDFSEDAQSAPRGGDVGMVPASALRQVSPQLRDAVMKSPPGNVSMVAIDGGYTIVAVVAKQAAGQRDLSMPGVRDGITATLRGRREQLLRTVYVEAARNKATVVNHLARRLVESQGKLSSAPTPAPSK